MLWLLVPEITVNVSLDGLVHALKTRVEPLGFTGASSRSDWPCDVAVWVPLLSAVFTTGAFAAPVQFVWAVNSVAV